MTVTQVVITSTGAGVDKEQCVLHRASAARSSSSSSMGGSARGARLDIIVHPRFRHTLPKHVAAPPPRHWDKLPIEVLHNIVSRLHSAQDVCRAERISRSCRAAANDERVWRDLCREKFVVPPYATPGRWKDLYRFNHELLRKCLMSHDRSARMSGLPPSLLLGGRIRLTA